MIQVYRSQEDKKIAGLCGGIADAYGFDPNMVRVAAVFVGLATGGLPVLAAYLVGWVMVPAKPVRVPGAIPHEG